MMLKGSGKELNKYLVNYVVINIETTGMASDADEIVKISAVKVRNEIIMEEYDSLVKPSSPIPFEVSELTGITDSMVEQSPVIKHVLTDFLKFIGDDVLVCHNAGFDLGFLNKAAMDLFGSVIGNDYIDTCSISQKRLPKLHARVLSDFVDYYGINIADESGLLKDCHIVKEIYECLFHRRKVGDDGIIELHCHTTMTEGKGLIPSDELIRYAYDKGYRAIAITDYGNVQAFPESYRTWREMWNEYRDGCRQAGQKADKNDFLKVIYGLEGNLLAEDGCVYTILLYAKNDIGIKNLYKIVTASNLEYYDEIPLIPRKYLDEHRDGLIVGSACDGGEIFTAINSNFHALGSTGDKAYRDHIRKRVSYYDFLEIVPYNPLDNENDYRFERYMYYETAYIGVKPMLVASDAYYLSKTDKKCWEILTENTEGYCDLPRHLMSYDEDCKKSFNKWTFDAPEILRNLPEKLFENRTLIADQIDYVNPLREERFIPDYSDAGDELTNICTDKMKVLFGDNPAYEVRKRLERELKAIKENGYAGIYMMWRQLIRKSLDKGYPTGISGAVGSSFVAYLCGITEINPLSKEQGGYQIPVEVFMGLKLDREPVISIDLGTNIKDVIQEYISELPGVGEICHCGAISTMAEKTAERKVEQYYYKNNLTIPDKNEMDAFIENLIRVKNGNDIHPDGIIVCPKDEELVSFTPLTHPYPGKNVTTEFDYRVIDGNLLTLHIFGHKQYDVLHVLQKKTGVRTEDILLDDAKVLKFFCDVGYEEIRDFPKFGNDHSSAIIKLAKPETFDDLVKISALSQGIDVWHGNQNELFESGQIVLSDCISSRDDIFLYLTNKALPKNDAYNIMESVRKGMGLTDAQKQIMMEAVVPEWYIQACEKIRYLVPKSHAISYTMMMVRLAYYWLYYPEEYYESLSEVD